MFFEDNKQLLADFSRLSKTAGARADYVQGGGGNTSVKLSGGLMAIKASGFCYIINTGSSGLPLLLSCVMDIL